MSKLFNFIDKETTHNCAGELKAEDLPSHDHHLLYYTKEQCEAMFSLAQHNHDDRYYKKIDVYTKGESITNFASKTHQHYASTVNVDTNNFNKNLTSAENTVQKALDKLDDMDLGGGLPPHEPNKLLYGKAYPKKWLPTTNLQYTEETGMSRLEVDKKQLADDIWYRAGVNFSVYSNNKNYSAGWSCNATSKHPDGQSVKTNVSLTASKNSSLDLRNYENPNSSLSIGIGRNYNNVFSYEKSPSVSSPQSLFSIKDDSSIKSSFLKGTGTMPLVANSSGVILRGDTPFIKSISIPFTLTGGSPDGFSFNRLFTWAELGISLQPTLYNMQKKIFSVTCRYENRGNWKEIENFRHEITGLGLQCSGTVFTSIAQLQINILFYD